MPRSADARTAAINAAVRLFDRQGYHGTGLADILAASGAPRGSFYFHFPGGKEQLGVEAVARAADDVAALFHTAAARHPEPDQLLRSVGRALIRWLERSEFQEGCAVAAVTVETAITSETLRLACQQAYTRWQQILTDAFTAGGLPAERSARLASLTISALQGAALTSRAHRDTRPLRDAVDTLADLAATALRTSTTGSPVETDAPRPEI